MTRIGLAVANSLAAIEGGARRVECTINCSGERAGNAALEEVLMALRTRRDRFEVGTAIHTPRLAPVSRAVAAITRCPVARTKAIVGGNAFAHEAGIHQHSVLACAATYEIMNPRDFGGDRATLVLGKHSGRHALRDRVRQLGYTVTDSELGAILASAMLRTDGLALHDEARALEAAIDAVNGQGVLTADCGGSASTEEQGTRIAEALRAPAPRPPRAKARRPRAGSPGAAGSS